MATRVPCETSRNGVGSPGPQWRAAARGSAASCAEVPRRVASAPRRTRRSCAAPRNDTSRDLSTIRAHCEPAWQSRDAAAARRPALPEGGARRPRPAPLRDGVLEKANPDWHKAAQMHTLRRVDSDVLAQPLPAMAPLKKRTQIGTRQPKCACYAAQRPTPRPTQGERCLSRGSASGRGGRGASRVPAAKRTQIVRTQPFPTR